MPSRCVNSKDPFVRKRTINCGFSDLALKFYKVLWIPHQLACQQKQIESLFRRTCYTWWRVLDWGKKRHIYLGARAGSFGTTNIVGHALRKWNMYARVPKRWCHRKRPCHRHISPALASLPSA
jgi:hypothetical protein